MMAPRKDGKQEEDPKWHGVTHSVKYQMSQRFSEMNEQFEEITSQLQQIQKSNQHMGRLMKTNSRDDILRELNKASSKS